jgi:hypothetical protein
VNDALDNLLRDRRVWRAVKTADDSTALLAPVWTTGLATGYPKLDRQLPGGGWPRQALTEILLEHYGTGELQLLMPALARLGHAADAGMTIRQRPAGSPGLRHRSSLTHPRCCNGVSICRAC